MKERKPQTIERLEQALRIWEDGNFLVWALSTAKHNIMGHDTRDILTGSVMNWQDFRKDVLTRKPYNEEKYKVPPEALLISLGSSPIMVFLPEYLSRWSKNSRRVYSLSEDFQRSLELTSIGSITWGDVSAPFPIFGISLPIPVKWSSGGNEGAIDFLLVDIKKEVVNIIAFGKEMDQRSLLTEKKKENIRKALDKRNYDEVRDLILGLNGSYFIFPAIHMMTLPTNDQPIMKDIVDLDFMTTIIGNNIISEKSQKLPEYWQLIVRMVVGLCLHIEMASKNKKSRSRITRSEWRKPTLTGVDSNTVVAESMICSVNTVTPLSHEEVEIHHRIRTVGIEAAMKEVSARFITSFWRRAPGTGKNPEAPKTVHVDSYLWGKNHLPQIGLPGGCEMRVA